jgi:3-deoxy-D-manno-octulosonate 8-phosphate phosphatase (KDO 8-P phosphatase)
VKVFNIKDGYAIHELLPDNGVQTAIITGCASEIVQRRAKMLGVAYLYQNITDKAAAMERLSLESGISFGEMACIGDDLCDLPAMRLCALSGCPADAVNEVREKCDFVSSKDGGKGAVREFAELILKRNSGD